MPNRFSLLNRVPLFNDLRRHLRADFLADTIAGSSTAILIIPQAIAYALLAGLPPQMGLYAAIIAPLIYALLGSSRTVIIGPAAVQAVMVAAAIAPLGGTESGAQITGALMIGLGSGALLLALGILRLGWLTNFISNPVLSGFTTGAVLYIIITQTGTLLGIPVPRDASPIASMWSLIIGLPAFQLATAVCGISAIGCLWLARYSGPLVAHRFGWSQQAGDLIGRISPLLIVFVFTILSVGFGLARRFGVPVVGAIPQALPSLHLSMPSGVDWRRLAPDTILIALIGYIESLSVAKALAFRRRERINPDRELVALGLTNVAGRCLRRHAGRRKLLQVRGQF